MLSYTTHKHASSKEWVTFIHGAGGSSAIWYKQIRDFSKHFNVLLIDLRGHGRSKTVNLIKVKRYNFSFLSDDVLKVINHLEIAKTHFIGISLGTIIIREIAERFPERCSSLIMGGAVLKINLRGRLLIGVGNLFKSILPYLLLYRLFAFVIMPKRRNHEARFLFINEAKKLYQKEFKRWFTLVSELKPLLRLFRFKEALVPTLYVMGEEDYMFLPAIKRVVKYHKNSQLVIIPNCGHVVNVEAPSVFNATTIDYILGRRGNPILSIS